MGWTAVCTGRKQDCPWWAGLRGGGVGAAWASQIGQWREQSGRWLRCGVCVHISQTIGSVWGTLFVGTQ